MPEIVLQILEVCLIPLLTALTAFAVKWLNAKANEIKARIQSEKAQHYIDLAAETVTTCVIATNQTYVEALKKQGSFDVDAQKYAFEQTYKAVLELLPNEAMKFIEAAFGDGTEYLTQLIEKTVNEQK